MTHTIMVLNNYFCLEISLPKFHATMTADCFLVSGNLVGPKLHPTTTGWYEILDDAKKIYTIKKLKNCQLLVKCPWLV